MTPHISPHAMAAYPAGIGDKTDLMRAWRGRSGWRSADGWLFWVLGLGALLVDLGVLGLGAYVIGFAHPPLQMFAGPGSALASTASSVGLIWMAHHLAVWAGFGLLALAWALGNVHLATVIIRRDTQHQASFVSGLALRAVQLGVVLLAASLFLGGLWSVQAEGRFWRWHNGDVWVLIVLLSYLYPLHARSHGRLGDQGLATAAVLCFGLVIFACFGVRN